MNLQRGSTAFLNSAFRFGSNPTGGTGSQKTPTTCAQSTRRLLAAVSCPPPATPPTLCWWLSCRLTSHSPTGSTGAWQHSVSWTIRSNSWTVRYVSWTIRSDSGTVRSLSSFRSLPTPKSYCTDMHTPPLPQFAGQFVAKTIYFPPWYCSLSVCLWGNLKCFDFPFFLSLSYKIWYSGCLLVQRMEMYTKSWNPDIFHVCQWNCFSCVILF